MVLGEIVDFEDTFAERLRHHLDEKGREVETVNAGVTGYGPDQTLLRFSGEAEWLESDLVVLVLCTHNDLGDLVRNKLIRPEIEADEIEEKTALATEGLINWKVGLALALAAWVGAMGVAAGATETDTLREVVRIGLYAPILAGLGFIAGVVTAKLLETGVGDYAALAARMALAVALAYLGHRLGMALDLPRPAPGLVGLLLAFGGYVATIFFTLSLTWTATLLLAGLHLVMWLLFRGLRWAIDWVEAGPAATGGH